MLWCPWWKNFRWRSWSSARLPPRLGKLLLSASQRTPRSSRTTASDPTLSPPSSRPKNWSRLSLSGNGGTFSEPTQIFYHRPMISKADTEQRPFRQGFGSVSGSALIRINLSCRIRIQIAIADPDPDPGGQKWPTKIEISPEFSCF